MHCPQQNNDLIRVYWQPGCTSCLRTKEFLTLHGIAFESRNVLTDPQAFAELARFGLRQVPIVTLGDAWANGQMLADVAKLVGVTDFNAHMLPSRELHQRVERVLEGAQRFFSQIPDEHLHTLLPDRPRSYSELAYHAFNIVDAFLEEKQGQDLVYESYYRLPKAGEGRTEILAYGAQVHKQLNAWFSGPGRQVDWSASANVYYGQQSQHQFLERTTWHSMQHARQLMWLLKRLGIAPSKPLTAELFAGLPMPEQVWEDEKNA
jgi:glutaredoxin